MMIRLCIVVPVYNHAEKLACIAKVFDEAGFVCIFVNDGSDEATQRELNAVVSGYENMEVLHHAENRGKGAACISGVRRAGDLGYTHVLQVDADGQHDLNDLPRFVEAANAYPDCLIMGTPVFDESVPKLRFYGRYLTHVCVWVECLSTRIKDTMCGYRVYPVEESLRVMGKGVIGRRMDFDTEIAVRLYWAGVFPYSIPTRVIYEAGSESHFKMVRDNVLISLMHTRLILGMLIRIPHLLKLR